MNRKLVAYLGLVFILMVMLGVTYFSYAFLIKTEEHHGKLNIVTGTLNYGLTADNLINNSITVPKGKTELKLVLRSLNKIDSKYQLYYQAPTGVVVGYPDTNLSTGIIQANDQVTISLIINNTTSSNQTVTFGVEGGFTGNTLVLSQGTVITDQVKMCDYIVGQEFLFPYNGTDGTNGSEQTFTAECDGLYKLETWGAQGGSATGNYKGGYGGYSVGNISLTSDDIVYVNVGGKGLSSTANVELDGGYNGGGKGKAHHNDSTKYGASGGGATHIALESGLLSSLSSHASDNKILIVAGAGGGAYYYYIGSGDYEYSAGGHAGGYTGGSVSTYSSNYTTWGSEGGTQSSGGQGGDGAVGWTNTRGNSGTFGAGGSYIDYGSGGGSGYYGGGGGLHIAGAGGSGYIGNTNLNNKAMYCYGCTEDLTNVSTFTVRTNGTSSYRDTTNCSDGYSSDPVSKCAKAGNGYAKITYLGKTFKQQILDDNTVVTKTPTLTTSSNNTSDASGLYKMSVTNGFGGSDGDTYYFRGDVTNNVVEFAGFIWRIMRVNEDGTVRLILSNGINNNQSYPFSNNYSSYTYTYYSNSTAKTTLQNWFNSNITGTNATKVASGNYFCEAVKVTRAGMATGSATATLYDSYIPDLKCVTDGNNKGLVSSSIGLPTYDELSFAGFAVEHDNASNYLSTNYYWRTMSPVGATDWGAYVWVLENDHINTPARVNDSPVALRPVINLKADVIVVKDSTTGHYIVQ